MEAGLHAPSVFAAEAGSRLNPLDPFASVHYKTEVVGSAI